MKNSLRSIGIDDGYFPIEYKGMRKKTLIASVLCVNSDVENLVLELVTVDGLDGTESAVRAVRRVGVADIVFQDGVTIAGFNVIDPEELSAVTGIPVTVIFKHDLNLEKIYRALKKHFSDWRERYGVIFRTYSKSVKVPTPWRDIRISTVNIELSKALNYIIKLQTVSPLPEPLRLADIVASGLTKNTVLLKIINGERNSDGL
ncbi:MAG: DUF99 family protein [Desulfurococcales archaeon]|nr:DUF99 family protein [Desulfurococcales archaeon]